MSGHSSRTARWLRIVAVAAAVLAAPAAAASATDFENPASSDTAQQPATAGPQRQDTPNDPVYDQAEPDTQQPVANRSTSLFDERFDLFGFPSALTPTAVYAEGPHAGGPQISGFNAAGAWKLTRGDGHVAVAILDTGIQWGRGELRDRIRLNPGELPLPQDAQGAEHPGAPEGGFDLNGNGVLDVDDFADDPRVPHAGSLITGEDLIRRFGDCVVTAHRLGACTAGAKHDNDANGYPNDIAGWNFFDDDNDPLDRSSYFAASNHGSGRADDAAESGNDGSGSIGVCPHCQILPLRVWDTFVSDQNSFALAVLYATDNGAQVIEGADGGLYHSAFAEQASQYAYDHGAVQTYSGDDLNTGNHNYPAAYGHTMLIQGTVPDTIGLGKDCPSGNPVCDRIKAGPSPLPVGTNAPVGTYFRGANTTQYGGKSSISMEGPTGSSNTGKASGAAGMVVSAALAHQVTLRPDETREILEQTAEDVTQGNTQGTGTPDPAGPGWDAHFGWGRVDLGRAVAVAADRDRIPDEAAVDGPDWYAPLTGSSVAITGRADARFTPGHQLALHVEWGAGEAPSTWHPVKDVTANGPVTDFGTIDLGAVRAAVAAYQVPADPGGPVFSPTSPNPYQDEFTVRVTVSDPTPGSTRLVGVDRRVLTAFADPDLKPGFPKRLGTGGEAPLRYSDLNGDDVQELVVPGEDGAIHAYEPDGSELAGWPVHTRTQAAAADHLDAPGVAAVAATAPPREAPRGVAIADLDGDGRPEVIDAAGTHLYVWEGDGTPRPGFPVSSNPAFCGIALEHQSDSHPKCGFLASPSVGHLEGSARPLDIVQPSLDGHVYAWEPDGTPVPHFPVLLQDQSMPAGTRVLAESINEAAVGDLNGDGRDDIVAGSNETYGASNSGDVSFSGFAGGAAGKSTRVYAIDAATGAFLPGWPISISGIIEDTLPLIGPGNDPAIVSVGGVPKVIASATSGSLATYNADGSLATTMRQEQDGPASDAVDRTPGLNLFESAAVGRLTTAAGTTPSVVKYELSLTAAANLLLVGQNLPYNHLIGAWDAATGTSAPAFPRITDDYQFLSSSIVAKVDAGTPANQVIAGTGLGLLHAYDGVTGLDAPGFPKHTGGWLFAPAALSTDGRMADVTREGYLFEWSSTAAACQPEWPSFRHDPRSSGNYDTDGTPPSSAAGLVLASAGGDRYRLAFRAPGDDGRCGTAARYLTKVDGRAVDLGLGAPAAGGTAVDRTVTLPAGAAMLTVQAVDEAGNAGPPAAAAITPGTDGGTGSAAGAGAAGGAGTAAGGGGTGHPGDSGHGAPGGGTPSAAACSGRKPFSSINRAQVRLTARRLSLSGRSSVRDCATGRLVSGAVGRVRVLVARQAHRRCRFLTASGRLGRPTSCARPRLLTVRTRRGSRGTYTAWSLRLRVRLPHGSYLVAVRGTSRVGGAETLATARNSELLRVR